MHHTKSKADIGVAKVVADLTEKGCIPCIPLSEHQTYDLVAVLSNNRIVRLQVKYTGLKRNGTIVVKSRTNWVDKKGLHSRRYRSTDFDYYALYCPEKGKVLYIPNDSVCPNLIRFDKTLNNQKKHVKWAVDYYELV